MHKRHRRTLPGRSRTRYRRPELIDQLADRFLRLLIGRQAGASRSEPAEQPEQQQRLR